MKKIVIVIFMIISHPTFSDTIESECKSNYSFLFKSTMFEYFGDLSANEPIMAKKDFIKICKEKN